MEKAPVFSMEMPVTDKAIPRYVIALASCASAWLGFCLLLGCAALLRQGSGEATAGVGQESVRIVPAKSRPYRQHWQFFHAVGMVPANAGGRCLINHSLEITP